MWSFFFSSSSNRSNGCTFRASMLPKTEFKDLGRMLFPECFILLLTRSCCFLLTLIYDIYFAPSSRWILRLCTLGPPCLCVAIIFNPLEELSDFLFNNLFLQIQVHRKSKPFHSRQTPLTNADGRHYKVVRMQISIPHWSSVIVRLGKGKLKRREKYLSWDSPWRISTFWLSLL